MSRNKFINICFNYGGQGEITEATRRIIQSGVSAEKVTPELIRDNLYHPELPSVDYIVRTSGEQRISNFLLWDAAYAELEFIDTHWPAFSSDDLTAVLEEYGERSRRFGQ